MFTSRKRSLEDPISDFFHSHESTPEPDFLIHYDQFDIDMSNCSSRAISPCCSIDQRAFAPYSEQQLDYASAIHHNQKRKKRDILKSNQSSSGTFSNSNIKSTYYTVKSGVPECPSLLKTAQESRPLIIDPKKVFPSSAYSVSSPESDTLIYYFPPHSESGSFQKIPISKVYQNSLQQFNTHQPPSFHNKQPLVLVFWGIDDDYISTLR